MVDNNDISRRIIEFVAYENSLSYMDNFFIWDSGISAIMNHRAIAGHNFEQQAH